MKNKGITAVILIVISIICIFYINCFALSQNIAFQTMPKENMKVFPTGNGSFILADISDKSYSLYSLDSNNKITQTAIETMNVESAFYAGSNTYLFSSENGFVIIHKIGAEHNIGTFADITLKNEKCITADNSGYIYYIDKRTPNIVRKNSLSGVQLQMFTVSNDIQSLFSYENNVFAKTKNGIINIEKNTNIQCNLPAEPFYFNGNYVYDSNNSIYEFDISSGFKKIIDTDYLSVCADTSGNMYAVKDKKIYNFDKSGIEISYYDIGSNIEKIYSSGYNIMVICGNTAAVLKNQNFTKIPISTEISETNSYYNNETNNNNNNNKNSSSPKNESEIKPESSYNISSNSRQSLPYDTSENNNYNNNYNYNSNSKTEDNSYNSLNYSINSSIYGIGNGYITEIPQGTTAAQLKKNINFGDYKIEFVNHNGKSVSSGTIGTGWKVKFIGNDIKEYAAIINGDITGEGNINSRDISTLASFICGSGNLSNSQLLAADVNFDGICDSSDLYILQDMVN